MDKGSKYCICTMQRVVRCEMKRSYLKDDTAHAIYSGWEVVQEFGAMVKQWLESQEIL